MSEVRTFNLAQTVQAAPRWARIYLPASGMDALVETLWLFTLGWQASRAGWAAGIVLSAGAAPAIAFVLWGGSLADRLGAHRIAAWTMTARVVVMSAWAALLIYGNAPAYTVAAGAFATGAIAGLHDPAVSALPRLLVPAAGLEASTNAQRLCIRLVQTIGPGLGGLLAGLFDVPTVAVVAAAIGLVPLAAFAVLRRVRPVSDSDSDSVSDSDRGSASDHDADGALLAGLRWIRSHPAVRRTVPVQAAVNLTSATIVMAALPSQARAYGWGAGIYGLATAAFGGGMLLGSLAAFGIRDRAPRRKVAIAVACAALSSIMVAVTGAASSGTIAVVAAGLMGLAIGPVGSVLTGWTLATSVQSNAALYGRVYAVLLLVTVSGEPLGFLVFAGLAGVTSTATTSIIFGLVGFLVALYALGSRSVRMIQIG